MLRKQFFKIGGLLLTLVTYILISCESVDKQIVDPTETPIDSTYAVCKPNPQNPVKDLICTDTIAGVTFHPFKIFEKLSVYKMEKVNEDVYAILENGDVYAMSRSNNTWTKVLLPDETSLVTKTPIVSIDSVNYFVSNDYKLLTVSTKNVQKAMELNISMDWCIKAEGRQCLINRLDKFNTDLYLSVIQTQSDIHPVDSLNFLFKSTDSGLSWQRVEGFNPWWQILTWYQVNNNEVLFHPWNFPLVQFDGLSFSEMGYKPAQYNGNLTRVRYTNFVELNGVHYVGSEYNLLEYKNSTFRKVFDGLSKFYSLDTLCNSLIVPERLLMWNPKEMPIDTNRPLLRDDLATNGFKRILNSDDGIAYTYASEVGYLIDPINLGDSIIWGVFLNENNGIDIVDAGFASTPSELINYCN